MGADPASARPISRNIVEWLFGWLLLGALAWAPVWYGSDRPIAWGINGVLFPTLAILYEITLIARRRRHPMPLARIATPALLFGGVVIWILIQNASWTPETWHHPIWQMSSEVLGRVIPGSISVDRDLTTMALGRLLTVASAFWLALQLGRDSRIAATVVGGIAFICAVYAVIGFAALALLPGGTIYPEFGRTKAVSSTFVNQNSFATYSGIGVLAALSVTLRIYGQQVVGTGGLLRLKIILLIKTTGGKAAFALMLLFLNLTALLLTQSRGGIISTTLGMLLLCLLVLRKTSRSGNNTSVVLALATFVIGAVFFFFGDLFIGRIEDQGFLDENRYFVLKATLQSILDSPWLGYGYGTFAVAFPMFRDNRAGVWGVWDRAHNTYAEVFQGLGLVFGSALIISVALLVLSCIRSKRSGQSDMSVPIVAAAASILVAVHALVDFSLQVQAVTLTYFLLLGAGVAQSFGKFVPQP